MKLMDTARILTLVALACLSLSARPKLLKEAKEQGIDGVTSCMSCHTSIMKDKVAFGPRGKFLKERKAKEGVEVDVKWLKEFKANG